METIHVAYTHAHTCTHMYRYHIHKTFSAIGLLLVSPPIADIKYFGSSNKGFMVLL